MLVPEGLGRFQPHAHQAGGDGVYGRVAGFVAGNLAPADPELDREGFPGEPECKASGAEFCGGHASPPVALAIAANPAFIAAVASF